MYSVRFRCGKQLAKEAAVNADIVSTVPESATPAALGYSKQVGPIILTVSFPSFSHPAHMKEEMSGYLYSAESILFQ